DIPIEPQRNHAPGVRTGMHLPDAYGPVATRAREPAVVGRESERRDPSVDLPELLESAIGCEELPGVAGRASTRVRIPHLDGVIAAAVRQQGAVVRVIDPRLGDRPEPVASEALHERSRGDVRDARVVAQPRLLV